MKIKRLLWLFEDRAEFITDKFGSKLEQKAKQELNGHMPAKDIVHTLTFADPTKNRQYLQWIVNMYLKGEFRLEDTSRIKDELSEFERVKSKLDKKDINQYKELPDLYKVLEPFKNKEVVSNKEADRIKTQQFFDSDWAEMLYKDDDLQVIIPYNQEASCWFGKGTKWCTAANKNNMFTHYNKRGNRLFIVIYKGEKYQLHFDKNNPQFMNAEDREINLMELLNKIPKLREILRTPRAEANGHEIPAYVINSEEQALEAVKYDGANLEFVPEELKTEDVCMASISYGEAGWAWTHLPKKYKTKENLKKAILNGVYIFKSDMEPLIDDDLVKFVIDQYKQNPEDDDIRTLIAHFPKNKMTPNIATELVQLQPYTLFNVPYDILTKEMVRLAYLKDPQIENVSQLPIKIKNYLKQIKEESGV